ncbi:MAG: substrate-binding domain-containing protein [Planctomycetota bacterium]
MKYLLLGQLLIVAATSASSTGAGAANSVSEVERPLRFVFITCSVEGAFFKPIIKGMQDAAELMNVECKFTGTEGVDLAKQAAMVRAAVADGVDGIALNLIDPEAFDEVVQEALDQGVPVVAFNVDDQDTPNARLSAVNQRLYDAGRRLAEETAPHIEAGSHVLLTMHDRGISSLDDRLRGLQDVLRANDVQMTVGVTGNNARKGVEVVAKLLRENPEIRVVLGTGQADTEAAGRAIERDFADGDYWSAGFDLSPETLRLIDAGHIRCTVDQQPYIQGFYPVVQLAHYVRYGIAPSDIDAGATIIDRRNVKQVTELTKNNYR